MLGTVDDGGLSEVNKESVEEDKGLATAVEESICDTLVLKTGVENVGGCAGLIGTEMGVDGF